VKPQTLAALAARRQARRAVVLITRLDDGAQALVDTADAEGELPLGTTALAEARALLQRAESGLLDCDAGLFARSYVPPPRLLVVGAVHIAQTLHAIATAVGYEVTIIDPRAAFAASQGFAAIGVVSEWPDAALRELAPDAGSAVVTLSHDPKLDDPALLVALRSPAFYVGALGSRRTHAQRVTRLQELGVGDQLHRVHAPVGLALGGRSAGEIAVAIMAEIVQVRCRAVAAPLS
jgi:xanthine dehydrogenase accessory factor